MRVFVISTIFTILAALVVSIRLWTRFKLVRSPGLDDLFIFAALLCSLAFYGFILVERHYGLGIAKQQLPDDVITNQLHYLWLSIPFYNLALILSKLSALFLFIRIFRTKPFLLATYITMGFLIVAGLWVVLSGFIFCIPISDFWHASPSSNKHCLPKGPVWYSNAAMQIFSDIVILILPMPLLYKLQLPRQQKIGIMLVFGVGILYVPFFPSLLTPSTSEHELTIYLMYSVIATSSARLYELSTMVNGHDFTKKNAEAAVWSSLESNVSIICACMAPSTPLSQIFSPSASALNHFTQPLGQKHTQTRPASLIPGNVLTEGGIFSNDFFYAGPGGYTASISKLGDSEKDEKGECEGQDGIRVVRELRMVSDSVMQTPRLSPRLLPDEGKKDIELGEVSGMGSGSGSGGAGQGSWNPSIEWDLGDFEFPDYKERMNAPI
ncbi:uncharacterized protein N7484_007218 [Penicillium longicatenatum]|uniref:uncharacterized protein n=1 Tax=Penicillium longicatenatum TaxID=1561947 RepID=UPI00254735B9|nr:uncharacterized protein N7484_007218 [Penicillium longicatenatum]KAJ5639356.1 hypothetical protein N7484_007218 [Penicillium longicatenatum]